PEIAAPHSAGVIDISRVVGGIDIQIRLSAKETDRVFSQEFSRGWIVVTCPVVIQPCFGVELSPREQITSRLRGIRLGDDIAVGIVLDVIYDDPPIVDKVVNRAGMVR